MKSDEENQTLEIEDNSSMKKMANLEEVFDGNHCLICDKQYPMIRQHVRHRHKIDPDSGRDISEEMKKNCKFCKTEFSESRSLSTHMRQVEKINNFLKLF